MKKAGYFAGVYFSLCLAYLLLFMNTPLLYVVPVYFGVIVYLLFRTTWTERIPALKKTVMFGVVITVILTALGFFLRHLANKLRSLSESEGFEANQVLSMFSEPSLIFTISLGVIFIVVPALLAFLEGTMAPDQEGLRRNPWLVLVYVVLSLGVYTVYWFWLIKKGLHKSNIQTRSLWWFLVPILGVILLYIDFSKALEQRTKRKFITWFLIFLVAQGMDVAINQAILNHDLLKK